MPDPTPAATLTAEERRRLDRWILDVIDAQAHELAVLREVAAESNAVCACGCPAEDHEHYGEDGEACAHEDHECVRTSRAVLSMLAALRAQVETIREETLAEAVRAIERMKNPRPEIMSGWIGGKAAALEVLEALRQRDRP